MKTRLLLLLVALTGISYAQKIKINKHYPKDKVPAYPLKGIWEFYDSKGNLEQKYDFDKDSLLNHTFNAGADTVRYEVVTGTGTNLVKLDRPPIPIGGYSLFFNP
jgi:hypothetical protein